MLVLFYGFYSRFSLFFKWDFHVLEYIQFAHSFKKDIAKVQKCFHVFNEREIQNQINIKSLLLDANSFPKF